VPRIAVLDRERCKPKDCDQACIRFCPLVRSRVEAIKIEPGNEKPTIFEGLCAGCGICIRKCPYQAISIVNLPAEIEGECSHRFGKNLFQLYRLPVPRPGFVTGLIGKNGIGKSTALKILSGEIRPNLGNFEEPPDWEEIIRFYRGSTLQDYFKRLSESRVKAIYKPQYVDQVPKVVSGTVWELLEKADEKGKANELIKRLQLDVVRDRQIGMLSGGELQRLTIAVACLRNGDLYLFDEPSSYLDVHQRIEVAKVIRGLREEGKAIITVEHDLAVLDYLSDHVQVLYGEPGVYGVLCKPQGVRVGINTYLDGYVSDENIRFRDASVRFHAKPPPMMTWTLGDIVSSWSEATKTYSGFRLKVEAGSIHRGEVVGVIGSNGIGKTTFMKLIAGIEKADKGEIVSVGSEVSYKPQYISVDYSGTVRDLLQSIAKAEFDGGRYKTEIVQPLSIERVLDRNVSELSGGERQRVAIAACLSRRTGLYLLDEPSAYLDVEERLAMARTIRRAIEDRGATAFVVEHDVSALDFIADRVMVFDGIPGVEGNAHSPQGLREGMNTFLQIMNITFRRDPQTGRPRVNKEDSRLDKRQKSLNEYYYVSEGVEEEE
jgi:ATP-binding cassette subfamily E protein 1